MSQGRKSPQNERRSPGRRKVTMREVAERAGVGMITVSRATTDPSKVSPALRERIDEAIRELGYVQNRMAGGLKSKLSRVVPVIVPAIRNAVFSDLVEGVNDVLLAAGFQILLGTTDYDLDREERLVADFLGWTPEGIIIVGADHTDTVRRMLDASDATVVELFERSDAPIEVNIGFSNTEAAGDMVRYLLDAGYHRIAFVGANLTGDQRADQRRKGFEGVLAGRGIRNDCVLAYPEKSSLDVGARAVHDVQDRWPDIDAVFFANDILAVGALLEANRIGLDVPGELAMAGFNGLEIGARTTPSLTTVALPHVEMGRKAAEAILQRRGKPRGDAVTIDIPYQILARAST